MSFIFPVNSEKKPILRGESWKDYSTDDPAEIRKLWARAGDSAYVGVDCGKSMLVVLDVDYPEAQPSELIEILNRHPTLTLLSLTRGLPHYYFRGQFKGKNFPWGEVKGDGGYVVVADPDEFWDMPIMPMPDELAEYLGLTGTPAESFDRISTIDLEDFFTKHSTCDLEDTAASAFLDVLVQTLERKVGDGEHRREACRDMVFAAGKESAAGFYPAKDAYLALEYAYMELRDRDPEPSKRYTNQRAQDFDRMWKGVAAKLEAGFYDDEIKAMRYEKGLDFEWPM